MSSVFKKAESILKYFNYTIIQLSNIKRSPNNLLGLLNIKTNLTSY